MNLLLAPHSDDETLFAAYVQLKYKPLVVICLEGRRKKNYVPNSVREAETAAATKILGCDYRQLPVYCDPPDYDAVEQYLREYNPEHVWAPYPEPDGNSQHNAIGELATKLWPDKTSYYVTYSLDGVKTPAGELVKPQKGWENLKKKALACYMSQATKPDTAFHFEGPFDEYIVEVAKPEPVETEPEVTEEEAVTFLRKVEGVYETGKVIEVTTNQSDTIDVHTPDTSGDAGHE